MSGGVMRWLAPCFVDWLWVLGLDAACAWDINEGADGHPVLTFAVLALFNVVAVVGTVRSVRDVMLAHTTTPDVTATAGAQSVRGGG